MVLVQNGNRKEHLKDSTVFPSGQLQKVAASPKFMVDKQKWRKGLETGERLTTAAASRRKCQK